jgi:trk system potassium uptake protein
MRFAFVGAGEVAVRTAELLIDKGHEVVVIESDQERIDELADQLDCSFLKGDGSSPAILRELNPKQTDVLFSISNNDPTNLIASLVGRSLGFKRVITSIQNPDFDEICRELGLEDTIIPSRTISRYLADMAQGIDIIELSTIIKDTARFFMFIAGSKDAGRVADLKIGEKARVVCYYRDGRFVLADQDDRLKTGDEVIILTDDDTLQELKERFQPNNAQGPKADSAAGEDEK